MIEALMRACQSIFFSQLPVWLSFVCKYREICLKRAPFISKKVSTLWKCTLYRKLNYLAEYGNKINIYVVILH